MRSCTEVNVLCLNTATAISKGASIESILCLVSYFLQKVSKLDFSFKKLHIKLPGSHTESAITRLLP